MNTDNTSYGYVKQWRSMLKDPLWTRKPFGDGQAWADLILLARHKAGRIKRRGQWIRLQRGDVAKSTRSLANRWGWSRWKVRQFLKELETDLERIRPLKNNVTSIIHIINYDHYQADRPQNPKPPAENPRKAPNSQGKPKTPQEIPPAEQKTDKSPENDQETPPGRTQLKSLDKSPENEGPPPTGRPRNGQNSARTNSADIIDKNTENDPTGRPRKTPNSAHLNKNELINTIEGEDARARTRIKSAQDVYDYYLETVGPLYKTRQRAIANITHYQSTYDVNDLIMAIDNYNTIANGRLPQYRKDPANFFGKQEKYFIDFLPGKFKPLTVINPNDPLTVIDPLDGDLDPIEALGKISAGYPYDLRPRTYHQAVDWEQRQLTKLLRKMDNAERERKKRNIT